MGVESMSKNIEKGNDNRLYKSELGGKGVHWKVEVSLG